MNPLYFAVFAFIYITFASTQGISDFTSCGRERECINIRQCPIFLYILRQKPILPRWVRFLRESVCGYAGSSPLVCCPQAPNFTTTTLPTISHTKVQPLDLDIIDVTYHRSRFLLPDDCGSLSDDNRITNGDIANMYEFPWMALLGYVLRGKITFRCGGTLINSRYVLTAAHCLTGPPDPELVFVRLGEHNLATDIDCEDSVCAPPVQDIEIEEKIRHPQYSKLQKRNDIALLRLRIPAAYNQAVQPVCLPIGSRQQLRNLEGERVTVTGWGTTERGTTSPILLKVSLPVASYSKCAAKYNSNTSSFELTPFLMCAGGTRGKDSCTGDSGGPLQTLDRNREEVVYVQFAIVTFGPVRCGTEGWPGVYIKVGPYMKWILDTIRI